MKLFLSSQAISKEQAPHLTELVGKPAGSIRLAAIENAADVEAGPKPWLLRNRQMIESHGFDVKYVDLRHYASDIESLQRTLTDRDVLWFGGGNTFYLRWLIHDLGIENILRNFIEGEKVYGGGSAGSIIAGPTLKHFEAADDIRESPEVLWGGLALTDKVILPHMDNAKYASLMREIDDKLQADGYQTVPLTDMQALVVDGSNGKVI